MSEEALAETILREQAKGQGIELSDDGLITLSDLAEDALQGLEAHYAPFKETRPSWLVRWLEKDNDRRD